RLDRLGHLLRLLAVDGAVLELDHRILLLARELLDRVALAIRMRDDDVVDARLVERLLHAPAGMAADLDPEVRAPVELHGHEAKAMPSAGPRPGLLRDLLALAGALAAEGDARRRRAGVV